MKASIKIFLIIIIITLPLYSCIDSFKLLNQDKEINIGDVYLHSFDWDEKDPFEEVEIDTIKVLSIRDEYVKWEYINKGYFLSGKLKHFKHRIKPFK